IFLIHPDLLGDVVTFRDFFNWAGTVAVEEAVKGIAEDVIWRNSRRNRLVAWANQHAIILRRELKILSNPMQADFTEAGGILIPKRIKRITRSLGGNRDVTATVVAVHDQRGSDLPEIAEAGGSCGSFTSAAERRQQYADEDGDDADDNQKLDKRKSPLPHTLPSAFWACNPIRVLRTYVRALYRQNRFS